MKFRIIFLILFAFVMNSNAHVIIQKFSLKDSATFKVEKLKVEFGTNKTILPNL